MKKNVILVIASAVAFALLFVFFSSRFKSPENAMVPPKPSRENQEILQAFEDSIGRNTTYQLQYPQTGDYRNAFIFNDLDGDGKNEVLVFYTSSNSQSTTRVNVLDQQKKGGKDKWVSVLDKPGYGMDVYSVSFDDLNGDNSQEMIVSWLVVPNNQTKNLTVEKFDITAKSRLEMRTLLEQQYRYMGTADMDGDSKDELLVIWSNDDNEVSRTYASLFKMDKDSNIRSYGKRAALDNDVSGYSSLKFQKGKDRNIAFLDAWKGERGMITELIWWDRESKALVAPFSRNDSFTNSATFRPFRIPSRSVGNDPAIQIPLLAPDYNSARKSIKNMGSLVPLVRWNSVNISGNDVQLVPREYTLVNTREQYILTLKSGQTRNLLAVQDRSGVMSVYNYASGKRGALLFSIALKEKDKAEPKKSYSFRIDHGDLVAYGTLTSAGSQRGFTNDFLEQNLLFY